MSTKIDSRDPRATMGRMVGARHGNVPRRAILAAETAGVATVDGAQVPFEVQVWRVPASCVDAGTLHLRIYNGGPGGFARSWSYSPRRAARCWTEYGELVAGLHRDADAVQVVRHLERAA